MKDRPWIRRVALATFLALVGGCAPGGGGGTEAPSTEGTVSAATPRPESRPRPTRGTAWVIFGADTVVAEVARTEDQRARGLMNRREVPDGTGMLFVWETPEVRSFWMQNTYVSLDIAFFDTSYNVIDIQQMEAETTTSHDSAAPAMFALEVRQGWFAEQGIQAGRRAEIVFGP